MVNGTCGGNPFTLGPMAHKVCDQTQVHTDSSSVNISTPEWELGIRVRQVFGRVSGPQHRLDVILPPEPVASLFNPAYPAATSTTVTRRELRSLAVRLLAMADADGLLDEAPGEAPDEAPGEALDEAPGEAPDEAPDEAPSASVISGVDGAAWP